MAITFGTPGAIRAVPPTAGHFGQGVKYPLAYDSKGRLSLSFGPSLVDESIQSICRTQRGERVMLPDYGIGQQLFEPAADADRIRFALSENIEAYEPRISQSRVDVELSLNDSATSEVTIRYAPTGEADTRTVTAPYFSGPAASYPGT